MQPALSTQLFVSQPVIPAELPQNYRNFCRELLVILPEERLYTDPLRCLAYGTDASFYRLIPKAVVKVQTEEEVSGLLRLAHRHDVSVTFRAAGTSLSGQAITDSVLVLLAGGWRGHRIEAQGERIALQPGVVGSRANDVLRPYGRKIGPDPASINAAMIGGIAANNASGMCCGVDFNSYRTLHSMRVLLADGHLLDTGDPESRARFSKTHKTLLQTLADYAARVRNHSTLADRIRKKFQIKNTTGYSLNALVDFEDPIEILQHLMIGSEGTLGFISEITYQTIPDPAFKGTALVLFPNIVAASAATFVLKQQQVDAVELLDRASLRSIEGQPTAPASLKGLEPAACALLIETGASTAEERDAQVQVLLDVLAKETLLAPPEFTGDAERAAGLWKLRKGLFPSVGNLRKAGTTVIIEDFAVSTERLAEAVVDLRGLFDKYHYDEAILFGHALDGNLHFCFTQDFSTTAEVERYEQLMADVCDLLIQKYDGSLKAEHGTGRNMAPFVELEWGREAYELMEAIKELFDPDHLLNPGVILNPDPKAHIKDLKPLPVANPIVDKCIECGFCEVQCPSRDLTLSPRQRITVWREIRNLQERKLDAPRLKELRNLFHYDGEDTCATDGLCATSCPVNIDTGKLVKQLRHDQHPRWQHWVADWLANHFAFSTQMARWGLEAAHQSHRLLGTQLQLWISRQVRKWTGKRIPPWNPHFPRAAPPVSWNLHAKEDQHNVVYVPSCICRMMGPSLGKGFLSHPEAVQEVLKRAGFEVIHPAGADELCCGVAFDSKGFPQQAQRKTKQLGDALREASANGRYPILCETSPCVQRLQAELPDLPIYDPVDFVHDVLMDRLKFIPLPEPVVIHPTCSNRKGGHVQKMKAIAERCTNEVILPHSVTCCGTAGDRGIFHPELPSAALATLREQIPYNCSTGVSNSRTCEIGLSMVTDLRFESLFHLLIKATGSRKN